MSEQEEKTRAMSLRLPEDLVEALDESARRNWRSRSAEIIVRLKRDLRLYPAEEEK